MNFGSPSRCGTRSMNDRPNLTPHRGQTRLCLLSIALSSRSLSLHSPLAAGLIATLPGSRGSLKCHAIRYAVCRFLTLPVRIPFGFDRHEPTHQLPAIAEYERPRGSTARSPVPSVPNGRPGRADVGPDRAVQSGRLPDALPVLFF